MQEMGTQPEAENGSRRKWVKGSNIQVLLYKYLITVNCEHISSELDVDFSSNSCVGWRLYCSL